MNAHGCSIDKQSKDSLQADRQHYVQGMRLIGQKSIPKKSISGEAWCVGCGRLMARAVQSKRF